MTRDSLLTHFQDPSIYTRLFRLSRKEKQSFETVFRIQTLVHYFILIKYAENA